MAEVQKRRQAEDERRQKTKESLETSMQGMDVNDMKNLAKVEEMELPVREPPSRRDGNENGDSERWTPAWNGVRRGNDTRIHVAGSHLCFIRHLIAALLALAGMTLKDWRWRVFQVRSFARKRRVCTERADSHA